MALRSGAMRSRFWLASATLVLAACSGDSSSNNETGAAAPPPPSGSSPGSLASTAGVSANLAVVAGEIPLAVVRPIDFTRVARPVAAPNLRFASLAAVMSCGASGTRDVSQATRDVDSPYTDAAMLVTRTVYSRCVEYAGPPQDPTGATRELHGIEEFGEAGTADGTALFVAVGDAQAQQPLERRQRAVVGGVEHEEESLALGRADAFLDDRFDVDAQLRLSRTFVVSTDGDTVATGNYRLGSDAGPFRLASSNARTAFAIDGEFQFQSGRCNPGPAQVATTRDLQYDPVRNRFVGGLLTFTSALGTATAEFNADGTVTLMDTQGRTVTIDWRARSGPWDGNPCFEP